MLKWVDSRHSLGVEDMDGNHREFLALVEELEQAKDEDFPFLFQKLLDHTRLHFAEENLLMRQSKFPPTAIHEGEHARVLNNLIQINNDIQAGRLPLARAFVKSGLHEWFELHLATMDRALAMHLARTSSLAEPRPQPRP